MAKVRKVPKKYTSGVSKSTAAKRKAQIRKRSAGKVSKSEKYKPLAGDSKKTKKKSSHTIALSGLRKEISATSKKIKGSTREKFIKATAKESGVPVRIIGKVYKKGEEAWATGHRVGATQQQWAKARVYSFLNKGKTATTADAALYKEAKKKQRKSSDFKLK